MPDRRDLPWRGIAYSVAAAGLVVFIVLLGVLIPPRQIGVSTDRLGPEQGEQVTNYLARAHDTLNQSDDAEHWALVSFTEYLTPQQIPAHSGGLRIARVIHHVPIDRVQTPVLAIPVPPGDEVAVASANAAASALSVGNTGNERTDRVHAVSAARLRAGCACTAALLVRGPLPQLRALATQPGIRAVEALPPDAESGRFALVPLLPEQTSAILPPPDDGPVPNP
ncbi:hypothetical protein [Nocardia sp. NPDC052566]|uniref:hypothetical protein n=1 Tax=Nocardia sp. NPDC052566 TaxID=3364330 RepID=UPI0037C7FFED